MKKRIIGYRTKIDALLEQPPEGTEWELILQEHLTQVSFFQHERLIVLLLVLLVPYIGHYYTLENEVQKMYKQYDVIWSKVKDVRPNL